ncbi:MAG: alpha/beta fold hydrolase [Deltaproteobacteria bacterium]|jgi:fermentation-respiration switch protein FrsA (DUF1100 family)|nr:alpha/beta fold hydrolase [Deltaproteobacteria bacterium]
MAEKNFWAFLTKGFYFGHKGMEVRELSRGKVGLRIVVSVVVGLVILLVILKVFKNSLIFFPVKEVGLTPASTGWAFEDLYLKAEDGSRLNCWYLPGPNESKRVVLIFHGNGGNLENMVGRVMTYHKLDFGVMAVDYRGFGRSEGKPSEENTYQDAITAWDYLVNERGVDPREITIHGFSLGGGVASWLAMEKRIYKNPLILDSTFTKLSEVPATMHPLLALPARFILGDAYDTASRLNSISPSVLLVFHGPDDDIVPYKLGQELFAAYHGGPKLFFELQGKHLDYVFNQSVYADAIYKNISHMAPLVLEVPGVDESVPIPLPEGLRPFVGGGAPAAPPEGAGEGPSSGSAGPGGPESPALDGPPSRPSPPVAAPGRGPQDAPAAP